MQKAPATKLWLPGQGVVDLEPLRVHRALQAYDERLVFGRNMDTGDWCAFVKVGPSRPPIPVIAFGDTIPHPDDAVRRCMAADTRRHSSAILNAVTRDEIARREKASADANEEHREIFAEIMDYAYRKEGVHPVPRIFVSRSI